MFRRFALFAAILLPVLALACLDAAAAAGPPNVVFILADDLGYGDVGCYNPESRIPTPHMDRLAAEGMRFTDAHSPSAVCTPTRYGVLTGRYAWRTRLKRGVLWTTSPPLIEPGRLTVASLLRAHGYTTACFGKWHLGMEWPTTAERAPDDVSNYDPDTIDYAAPVRRGPCAVGFDEYFGIPASLDMSPYFYVENDRVVEAPTEQIGRSGGLAFWRAGGVAPGFRHADVMPLVAERAVGFLEARDASTPPFFLYLPLSAPHTPVVTNEPFRGRSAAGPYGDFVVETDALVGDVLDALDRNGLAENTLVIVTSDNGSTMTNESLADYGHRANGILRGRKSDAWEGGHRVPFIARWPAVVPAGTTCDASVGLIDLFATCAGLVDAAIPDDAGEDSFDLGPLLAGAGPTPDRALVHHSINGSFAIREGPWKLLLARGSGGWTLPDKNVPADAPPAQLYDLERDPSERTNLYATHPEIVARLGERLEGYHLSGRSAPRGRATRDDVAEVGDVLCRWPDDFERRWIGPDYFANRLQDWRIRGGRLECVETASRFPVRTVQLLTHCVGDGDGTLAMRVRTGPIAVNAAIAPRSWSGFLIGAGGPHVDYRLTALVHHRPAEDGGLLAVVDGRGRVAFRDNTRGATPGGQWSITGELSNDDVPVLRPSSQAGEGFGDGERRGPVDLHLTATPTARGYTLALTARSPHDGAVLSHVTVNGVDAALVDGGLALASNLGPRGSDTGFWFRDWTISGTKVEPHPERAFGPVLCAQHTVSRGVLKMTAQMGPLGDQDARTAELQVRRLRAHAWETVATAELAPDSYTFTFRVDNWRPTEDVPYRITYELTEPSGLPRPHYEHGTIRAEPHGDEIVVAAFTGHKVYTGGLQWSGNGIWFPHRELVDAVRAHDPDFLFFSGDQIYEGDLTPGDRRTDAIARLDYLTKWYRWCWAFRELTRDLPCVCIPDDHDVYHGNVWGAGGRAAVKRDGMTAQDSGGYRMSPGFVNMVHRTQTSHLPDPYDATPIEQDISVYYTTLDYGGLSFAILADRMWKSAPAVVVPEGKVVNGWFQEPEFDPRDADVPGAVLLGPRQLEFLDAWAADWSGGTWMKVALSQTILANVATIPRDAKSGSVIPSLPTLPPGQYLTDQKLAADCDSNGWPQSGRDRAVAALRRAFAMHIAGDQHLATTIQYGIDDWRDAGYAFSTPSIANTWPRRWFPPAPGANRDPDAPLYTGDFRDGFGNLMTVYAAANPSITGQEPARLHDRTPGYGIVRFDRLTRKVTIECWPRWVDPTTPDATQYPGWPIVFNQLDNDGRPPHGWLPEIRVRGIDTPVVQVIDEADGKIVYTLRIRGDRFRPKVFAEGTYTVVVGEPPGGPTRTFRGLVPKPASDRATLDVELTTP